MAMTNRPQPSVLAVIAVIALSSALEVAALKQPRLASPALEHEPPSIRWNQTVPLTPPDPCLTVPGSVETRGVAIGPDLNPVVVGEVAGPWTLAVAVKYDRRSGERAWCHSFPVRAAAVNGTTFLVAFAEVGGVAIDSTGTIFIGGHGRTAPFPPPPPSKPGPQPPSPPDRYFVTKCSSAGACASTVTFINPSVAGSHNDAIGGIAIGPEHNPVLTGVADFPSSFPHPSTFKLLTVKVNGSTLALLGQAEAPSNPPSTASSQGVAVDSSDDIIVTGTEASTSKYDSLLSPTPLWTNPLAGARVATISHRDRDEAFWEDRESHWGNEDQHASVHHDNLGTARLDEDAGEVDDVAVLRPVVNAAEGTHAFAVTELGGKAGVTLWTKTYGSGLNDIARDIALDRQGNILVAGDRVGQGGAPASRSRDGQLVSLTRTGELNWVAVVPTKRVTGDTSQHSFFAVTVGLDGDPVVTGYSDVQSGGPTRVMDTLTYTLEHPETDDKRSDQLDDERLAWDDPISAAVTGFLVCIDARTGTTCQDVGKPIGRSLRSTTPGSLTYEIALAKLTSFKDRPRRISVIAYNANGDSPKSAALSVNGSDESSGRDGR
jgi:hypothetical protein